HVGSAQIESSILTRFAKQSSGGVTADTISGNDVARFRFNLDGFKPFLDLFLWREHGANNEIDRLRRANRVKRGPDQSALAANAMTGRAGKIKGLKNLTAMNRVTVGLGFGGELSGEVVGIGPGLAFDGFDGREQFNQWRVSITTLIDDSQRSASRITSRWIR